MRLPYDDLDEPLYRRQELLHLRAANQGRWSTAREAEYVLELFDQAAILAERARRGDEQIHFERERFCRLLVRRAQRGGGQP